MKQTKLKDTSQIEEKHLPPNLLGQLKDAVSLFGGRLVAVRSSSVNEDLPEHSFAGIYSTFLNCSTEKEIIEAIIGCWRSYDSSLAITYRKERGIKVKKADMAVILQEMIPSEKSGVMFTIDPSTGDQGDLCIEAVEGLGESLVSGLKQPVTYLVEKSSLKIKKTKFAQEVKEILTEEQVKTLAEEGKKIEDIFGSNQDIEWSFAGSKFYFLQARPATIKPVLPIIWSNINVGEALPDVVTPITWDFIDKFFVRILKNDMLKFLMEKEERDKLEIFGLVCGRVYFKVNDLVKIFTQFPFGSPKDIGSMFGDTDKFPFPENRTPLTLKNAILTTKVILFNLKNVFVNSRMKNKILETFQQKRTAELGKLSEKELFLQLIEGIELLIKLMQVVLPMAFKGFQYYGILRFLGRRWLKDMEGSKINSLFSGLTGIYTAEQGLEIFRLAKKARDFPWVKDLFLEKSDTEIINALGNDPLYEEFNRTLAHFLSVYGHRCAEEIELSNPRWQEDTSFIIDIIRLYLTAGEDFDPEKEEEKRKAERERNTEEIIKSLVFWQRSVFLYCLNKAQQGMLARENGKSDVLQGLIYLRQVILQLGLKLAARNIIQTKSDIFFLTFSEIEKLTDDSEAGNFKKLIELRKRDYEANKKIRPPSTIKGSFDYRICYLEKKEKGDVLYGIGATYGRVKGKARVILDIKDLSNFSRGEILVAPATDPGWTPLFPLASGLITELGGLLSHGVIVAREYGLPAVVNVRDATKIIKDGDEIILDADKGEVYLLKG